MFKILRPFIRISAFLGKEIFEILRQPRLILTLILGPFLILFLFGIGYRTVSEPLQTIFVIEQGNDAESFTDKFAITLKPIMTLSEVADDREEALSKLRRNEVDVVVEFPKEAFKKIRDSEKATFNIYHNEIDPVRADYIDTFGDLYIQEVNHRVLKTTVQQAQGDAKGIKDLLSEARSSATAMREALEQGDTAEASLHGRDLVRNTNLLMLAAGGSLSLLSELEQTMETDTELNAGEIFQSLTILKENIDSLEEIEDESKKLEKVNEIETSIIELEDRLGDFQQIDPEVLVRPFRSEIQSVFSDAPTLTDFFAPAVIVLLLQHIAVTFAALALVRERRSGMMELFHVSPLTPMETLLGKYLSYIFFEAILTTILAAFVVFVLQVPMHGRWADFAIVMSVFTVTSLGVGFVISGLARSDSQAIQYSMFVLLASVFFSGFFLSLEWLWAPVRTFSWLLPATYGIQLLQGVMLKGTALNMGLTLNLAAIGLVLFVIAWYLLVRRMRRAY